MILVLDFPVQSASQAPLHCIDITIPMAIGKTDNIHCNCNVDCVFRGWHHTDVSIIGDTSEALATSVFKAKILTFSNAACTTMVPSPPKTLIHCQSTAVQISLISSMFKLNANHHRTCKT
jgi:hypothetical protein